MKEFLSVRTYDKYVSGKICDKCSLESRSENHEKGKLNLVEFSEFVSISFIGGYGSIWDDGMSVEVDFCQHCFKELCGKYCKTEDIYEISDNEDEDES